LIVKGGQETNLEQESIMLRSPSFYLASNNKLLNDTGRDIFLASTFCEEILGNNSTAPRREMLIRG